MDEAQNVIPLQMVPAGQDDSRAFFCDGRWLHYPTSDPEVWWARIPVAWPVITSEFGSKLRGMVNRVPKKTRIGAHNR